MERCNKYVNKLDDWILCQNPVDNIAFCLVCQVILPKYVADIPSTVIFSVQRHICPFFLPEYGNEDFDGAISACISDSLKFLIMICIGSTEASLSMTCL